MTLVQLQYIVAVDTWRHFATAAAKCFVTQPTLSMQIHKLEEELGVKLFDRSKVPVVPTVEGMEIIQQARVVLKEAERLGEIVRERKGEMVGEIRLGILPTLAPYLLPLFLNSFLQRYPSIRLNITELTTEAIVERLKKNLLDAGLLATPLHEAGMFEQPLFYEEFVVYVSPAEPAYHKRYVLADDIDVRHLWLLEEGHCMRSQIMHLCELKSRVQGVNNLHYEAGSIETLKKMVELHNGITILPELALADLTAQQQRLVRHFKAPAPVREISLVTHRNFVKQRILEALREEILESVPPRMRRPGRRELLEL
ncbi:MAG TPA: LysR substrate-binding domain-containing protein [Alphaproteobacteria bacterium]|nr:LysR substrate-binding domain-containing protein [Alphaproteobacteria bacterium]